MGFASRKRIRISDLNSEQFEAYVEKLDQQDSLMKKKAKSDKSVEVLAEPPKNSEDDDDNGIFKIALTEGDFHLTGQDDNNNQKGMAIF